MIGPRAFADLSPSAYQPHALHAPPSVWQERNCYIDLWIEAVHALGADPHAMLPVVLALDFEGDQWTFFKPSHAALWALYGIDVQELTVWRPMLEHLREHLGAGKLLCIEVDSHWLPDTVGTDYQQKHNKTSIVVTALDEAQRRLHYFHNAGFFSLEGDDFEQLLATASAAALPLFAELVKIDRLVRRDADDLRKRALVDMRIHAARRPVDNPVRRFAERFDAELPLLRVQGMDHYHRWAFGTIRQLGAAFELAARLCSWLDVSAADDRNTHWAQAQRHFDDISIGCKTLILKTARAVASGKPLDAAATCLPLIQAWDAGMHELDRGLLLAMDDLRQSLSADKVPA